MISGNVIRTLRLMKGIKQETMAASLGISQPAYCKLEHSNQINEERLRRVIALLGFTVEEFESVTKLITNYN